MDPIERFLVEQKEEGLWDSLGAFTAASDKALTKLASYQLPRPSAWILKMVQAGVAAGVSSISVDPAVRGMTITFLGGALVTPEELRDCWISPTATVSAPQKHLLVGLRALSVGEKRSVLALWKPSSGESRSLYWNGHELSPVASRRSLPGFLSERAEDELSFHISSDARSTEVLPWTRAIQELSDHAITCPIPLFLQGERLGHYGLGDVFIRRKPLVFGHQPYAEGVPTLLIADPRPAADADARARFPSAWLLYHSNLPAATEACWTQQGVVCQHDTFGPKSRFQLRLYLPADHLETDMTGLHLRFPEAEPAALSIGPALLDALRQLEPGSPTLTEVAQRLDQGGDFGIWTVVGGLVFLSAMLVPLTGAAGLLAGTTMAAAVKVADRQQRKRQARVFLSEVERWRQRLLEFWSEGRSATPQGNK